MHRTQGYSPIDTAKLCFDENLRQYVNAKTNPEAYNLNKGLYKMAETIETMQSDIEQLKSIVLMLAQELQRRS